MIGEPELDGEWSGGPPAEEARPEAPRGPAGRRLPWLWALGGALVASAVWAGVLAAQDRFSGAPRISYRHSEDLCKDAPLKVLDELTGGLAHRQPGHAESPSLDWAGCDFSGDWFAAQEPGTKLDYYGRVQVDLHRKTDPGPEFGAGLGRDPYIGPEIDPVEAVPGLGERAMVHDHMYATRLQVLDGGAVFTLTVQWHGGERTAGADKDAVAAAAIEDMRALMKALKKP
ncbi:hypothetical protein [Streptomyces sp. NPDC059072]|uniref:hypothetical protein n=1 Tax=unclassified Streptomyces TaxID=2593676 RepID=UPI0036C43AD1